MKQSGRGNDMERKQGKHLSAEAKLRVVEEGRQAGATISEVCRRHQVDHAQCYRWERLARQGALEALRNGARKIKNNSREGWLICESSGKMGQLEDIT